MNRDSHDNRHADTELNATMARYRAILARTYERQDRQQDRQQRIEAALREGNRVKAAYIQWAWVHRN